MWLYSSNPHILKANLLLATHALVGALVASPSIRRLLLLLLLHQSDAQCCAPCSSVLVLSFFLLQSETPCWAADLRTQLLDRKLSFFLLFLFSLTPHAVLQVYKRSFWTESFVQWSPKGSYVTTVHTRGVAVWGGPSFGRIQRFSHNQVRCMLSLNTDFASAWLSCSHYLFFSSLVHTPCSSPALLFTP